MVGMSQRLEVEEWGETRTTCPGPTNHAGKDGAKILEESRNIARRIIDERIQRKTAAANHSLEKRKANNQLGMVLRRRGKKMRKPKETKRESEKAEAKKQWQKLLKK
jgi:hypothetical protein